MTARETPDRGLRGWLDDLVRTAWASKRGPLDLPPVADGTGARRAKPRAKFPALF